MKSRERPATERDVTKEKNECGSENERKRESMCVCVCVEIERERALETKASHWRERTQSDTLALVFDTETVM